MVRAWAKAKVGRQPRRMTGCANWVSTRSVITFFTLVPGRTRASSSKMGEAACSAWMLSVWMPARLKSSVASVDGPVEKPITLQLTSDGFVIYAGEMVGLRDVGPYLEREKSVMIDAGKEPKTATVIVRADGAAKTGEVQEVIKICQEKGFEKFALRAKYDEAR